MSVVKLQSRLLNAGNRISWSSDDLARLAKHYGHNGPIPPIVAKRSPVPVIITSANPDPVTRSADPVVVYTWVISTAATDCANDQISVDGWDLSRFKSNPIVQYAHDGAVLPIGRALWTGVEAGRLKSKMVFSADDFAQRVRRMVDERVLLGASVGFSPGKWDPSRDPKRPGGINFTSGHQLVEWSVVNVPANSQCLLQASSEVARAAAEELEQKQPVATPFKDEAMRRLAEIKRYVSKLPAKDDMAARAAALRARRERPGKVNKV